MATEASTTQPTNPIGAVAGQFGLNGQIFIAQLINFLIVLVVLWKFVYKPVIKYLDERSEKIEKSVKQAQEIEHRVKAIEVEREQIVKDAQKQSAAILEKAYAEAQTRGEEIVAAAKREVERVIAKGKVSLVEEQANSLRELRKDVVELAVKAATQIIRQDMDEKKAKSLAEEIVRKMA